MSKAYTRTPYYRHKPAPEAKAPIRLTERGRTVRNSAIALAAIALLGGGLKVATEQHVEGTATIQPVSGESIQQAVQQGVDQTGVEVPVDDVKAAAYNISTYGPGYVNDRQQLEVTVSSNMIDNMLKRKTVEVVNPAQQPHNQQPGQ